ncbi:MAG: DEAD/DEAH box helicase [Cyanobacteriota bacterium]|jgi:SNF2 family DNA or RNA helicase|nr:DEAD/DEAH box helicase [Cyanobacteriota bacterium]
MRCLLRLGATGRIEVISPFDAVTQAQLRAVRPRGRWLSGRGCWDFPLVAAPALRQTLADRFPLEPELAQWLAWMEQPLPPLPSHRELVQAAAPQQPLPDGRSLLAHQRVAVRWLLARRGAVLADAMGLGKTLSALVAARAMVRLAGCRILVLAPVGLHSHWRAEAAALELAITLHSWASPPAALPPAGTVLIADEAHYAQNGTTARSQALLRLARHPRLRAIWLLSGTPMKNGRPAQLFPLLAAIDHPLARDQRRFEELFCAGHWRESGGRWVWQATGASRLEELRRLTRPLVLHRRKQDCLDLPPKHRHLVPVELCEAEELGFEHRLQRTVDDYRARAARGEVRPEAERLALLTALRRIASDYKLEAASSLVERLLMRREPVVVFSSFLRTAHALHQRGEALGGSVLLTGALAPAERQRQVDRFQSGDVPLLVATYGTGGLGFTLHRARHVLLIERPWTPGDAEQAEDRCHRIGMGHPLCSHWLQLGVADQLVDSLIASKAERIELVLGNRHLLVERGRLQAMVHQLLALW